MGTCVGQLAWQMMVWAARHAGVQSHQLMIKISAGLIFQSASLVAPAVAQDAEATARGQRLAIASIVGQVPMVLQCVIFVEPSVLPMMVCPVSYVGNSHHLVRHRCHPQPQRQVHLLLLLDAQVVHLPPASVSAHLTQLRTSTTV